MPENPYVNPGDEGREPETEREASTLTSDLPGESDLWEFLNRLAEEARKGRSDRADDEAWEDTEKVYWGDQWDVNLPSFKMPIVVNELKTYILTEVSDLTDNPIKVYVHKDRTSGDRDEAVEQSIQAFWQNERVDLTVMEACLDSMVYPAGFLQVTAEKQKDQTYKVKVQALHPSKVYPDPDATSEDDWRFVLVEDVLDLVTIHALWPERGERVRPEDGYSVKSATNAPWWQFWNRIGSGQYKGPLSGPGLGSPATGYLKARAAVLWLYIYDDEVEDDIQVKKDPLTGEPVLDAEGKETLLIGKKQKYPNGRMIVGSNGVILYDGVYPYTGPFPIVRVVSEPTLHQFWVTKSPVESVKELARAGNKLDSLVVENGIRLNSGIVIADTDSGLKPSSAANIPGQILLKRTGTQVGITYPPPMPPDMIQGGDNMRAKLARVLGMSPQRMGGGNRGNVSPELAETEISQAMGLTRLRARLLHGSVQRVVEQIFHRMAQYYRLPQVMPNVTAEGWKPIPWQPIASPEGYGVHVDPASFMVRSKTMLQRLTMALAGMGKVSTKYLLTMLDMPDADAEAERADKELAMAAQAKKNARKG